MVVPSMYTTDSRLYQTGYVRLLAASLLIVKNEGESLNCVYNLADNSGKQMIEPTEVTDYLALHGTRIKKVLPTGEYSAVLLTTNGRLIYFGMGDPGQLPIFQEKDWYNWEEPTRLDECQGMINNIYCVSANNSSLLLDIEGIENIQVLASPNSMYGEPDDTLPIVAVNNTAIGSQLVDYKINLFDTGSISLKSSHIESITALRGTAGNRISTFKTIRFTDLGMSELGIDDKERMVCHLYLRYSSDSGGLLDTLAFRHFVDLSNFKLKQAYTGGSSWSLTTFPTPKKIKRIDDWSGQHRASGTNYFLGTIITDDGKMYTFGYIGATGSIQINIAEVIFPSGTASMEADLANPLNHKIDYFMSNYAGKAEILIDQKYHSVMYVSSKYVNIYPQQTTFFPETMEIESIEFLEYNVYYSSAYGAMIKYVGDDQPYIIGINASQTGINYLTGDTELTAHPGYTVIEPDENGYWAVVKGTGTTTSYMYIYPQNKYKYAEDTLSSSIVKIVEKFLFKIGNSLFTHDGMDFVEVAVDTSDIESYIDQGVASIKGLDVSEVDKVFCIASSSESREQKFNIVINDQFIIAKDFAKISESVAEVTNISLNFTKNGDCEIYPVMQRADSKFFVVSDTGLEEIFLNVNEVNNIVNLTTEEIGLIKSKTSLSLFESRKASVLSAINADRKMKFGFLIEINEVNAKILSLSTQYTASMSGTYKQAQYEVLLESEDKIQIKADEDGDFKVSYMLEGDN